MIKVIINADDFGMSRVFNEKILDLLEHGLIHSTTVLVNRVSDAQKDQVRRLIDISARGDVSIGLHLDLDPDKPTKPQVEEMYRRFTVIFGQNPSHLDLHIPKAKRAAIDLHWDQIAEAIDGFANENNLPHRRWKDEKPQAKSTTQPVFVCTRFSYEKILEFVKTMEDGESYELLFHPGEYDPNDNSSLNAERKDDYNNAKKIAEFLKTKKNVSNISYLGL